MNYATVDDMIALWRPMSSSEQDRAEVLLTTVSSELRLRAKRVNMDLDALVTSDADYAEVAKSVTVDVTARVLMTSTDSEPVTQMSQSAMGYSAQASFLVPGGGFFIKKSELERLGIRRQRFGSFEIYNEEQENV